MSTRETVGRRADVKREDIDDVVAIAEQLQDAARREREGATAAEVQAAAAELDVAPEFVTAAITKLQRDREAAASAKEAAERAAKAQRARLLRWGGVGLGVVLSLGGVLGVSGASSVRRAAAATTTAQASLDTVLDRQANLAPQLVAMAGGDAGALRERAEAVRAARSVQDRLRASADLGTAMAEALGRIPPGTGGDQEALRYEVVGAANRVTVEQRRWAEAEANWRAEAATLSGGIAVGLGLAPAPTPAP